MRRVAGAIALGVTVLLAQPAVVPSGVTRWAAPTGGPGPTQRSLLRGSTTDLADLEVRAMTLPARSSFRASGTPARERLIIVKEGRVGMLVGGVRHDVGPGSVAVVLPGDAHDLTNVGTTPATLYTFVYRSKAAPDSARGRAAGGSFVVDWDTVTVLATGVGKRRNVFDRPTTMFRRFEMHASTLDEGLTNHAAHTHRAEELVLMLRGDARLLIGDRRHRAAPGDLVFLASQIPHALDNTGRGAAEYFAFQGQ